jgi:hypothetical protein
VTFVQPRPPRFSTDEGPDGLVIGIPHPRNWFTILFLPVWLSLWTVGEVSVGRDVLFNGRHDPFTLTWLLFWSAAGPYVLLWWLWSLFGTTIVIVGTDRLTLRRKMLGVQHSREYSASSIHGFHFREAAGAGRSRTSSAIQFSYGGRTVSFASDLDFTEGEQIIRLITARLPQTTSASSNIFAEMK